MILDSNRDALRERFDQGNAAYFTGDATDLNDIVKTLGEENVGVIPLPSGPIGNAEPFLSVQGFLFSTVSSRNQRNLALALAEFVTNSEQSATLMRDIRLIPANSSVRINPRLNPIVASFASQARSSAPVLNIPQMDAVLRLGNDAYTKVLEGIMAPAEAAFATTDAINQANGFAVATPPSNLCKGIGTLRLVYTWQSPASDVLADIIRRFKSQCPFVIIESEYDKPENLQARLAPNIAPGKRVDLVLTSQTWLQQMITDTQKVPLKNITQLVTPETLQKYRPIALNAMQVQNNLYGLPESVNLDALYYNKKIVKEPAQVLDDLRVQATAGTPIILDSRFDQAFWGIGAFGGKLFDQNYQAILDQGEFADWLAWLKESRDKFGIQLSTDAEQLKNSFKSGKSAYYVGSPVELSDLRAALGPDNLGVAQFPSGPQGPATPLLNGAGFFVNAASSDNNTDLALQFAEFATNIENQSHIALTANHVPANSTVDLSNDPAIGTFVEQAKTAVLIPNAPEWRAVEEFGQTAYTQVLEQKKDPVTVVADVTRQINAANGVTPTATPDNGTPTPNSGTSK